MKKEIDNQFIKAIQSEKKVWITDVYYGIRGLQQKGHLVISGAYALDGIFIQENTLINLKCEQPLYHRNAEGKVLLETGIKR